MVVVLLVVELDVVVVVLLVVELDVVVVLLVVELDVVLSFPSHDESARQKNDRQDQHYQ